jgi:hypothetical protein
MNAILPRNAVEACCSEALAGVHLAASLNAKFLEMSIHGEKFPGVFHNNQIPKTSKPSARRHSSIRDTVHFLICRNRKVNTWIISHRLESAALLLAERHQNLSANRPRKRTL